MGNFYVNHTVATRDADAVAATLERAGRVAYVIAAGDHVVVLDQASDTQDISALEAVGALLSTHHGAVLAVLDHDDDVLVAHLYERGARIDEYNSAPGYFEGDGGEPAGGDAARWCEAFGRPGLAAAVEQVLRDADGYTFAFERHHALVTALGLPDAAVAAGFRYISLGEVPPGLAPDAVRPVGGAPAPGEGAPPRFQLPPQPEVRVLAPLRELVGEGPMPLGAVFSSIVQYVHAHTGFEPDGATIRCDARLRAVFGADRVHMSEVGARMRELVEPIGDAADD